MGCDLENISCLYWMKFYLIAFYYRLYSLISFNEELVLACKHKLNKT